MIRLLLIGCIITALSLVGVSKPSLAANYTIGRDGQITINNTKKLPSISWGRVTGRGGVNLMKQENGNWLQQIYIRGIYQVDRKFAVNGSFEENFSIKRGKKLGIGNHHSFRYTLGLNYRPFSNGLTFYTQWDNRWLIKGHDTIFVEEYGSNRNYFGVFYAF